MGIFAFFGNFIKNWMETEMTVFKCCMTFRQKGSFWKGSRAWGSQVSIHNTSFIVKINTLGIAFCFGKHFDFIVFNRLGALLSWWYAGFDIKKYQSGSHAKVRSWRMIYGRGEQGVFLSRWRVNIVLLREARDLVGVTIPPLTASALGYGYRRISTSLYVHSFYVR